jgi:hypothetical protein
MIRTSPILLVAALSLVTCVKYDREAPSPNPTVVPDTDLCGPACKHLQDLGCEEAKDVYDSDLPGPVDVPNATCEGFCKVSQERGAFLNPRCLLLVPRCDQIETYRNKSPGKCFTP